MTHGIWLTASGVKASICPLRNLESFRESRAVASEGPAVSPSLLPSFSLNIFHVTEMDLFPKTSVFPQYECVSSFNCARPFSQILKNKHW